jgi:hypothetical protein
MFQRVALLRPLFDTVEQTNGQTAPNIEPWGVAHVVFPEPSGPLAASGATPGRIDGLISPISTL